MSWETPPVVDHPIVGLEIFSGAGGMSCGAMMAGIDVKMAVEIDQFAAATFRANHPGALMLNSDIRKVREIPKLSVKKQLRVLFGGPPCQGFSTSNQRTRNLDNDNNWYFKEFIRMTKLWEPDFIVFENVKGLVVTEDGYFLDSILKKFKALNYKTTHQILNASLHGVPQKRERLFIIGSKEEIDFKFPNPSRKIVTVRDALGDLPLLKNGDLISELNYKTDPKSAYAKLMRRKSSSAKDNFVTRNSDLIIERYKHIPQGGNWSSIPNRLMKNYKDHSRCHSGIYYRLKANEPSVVIGNYRKNMLIHPFQDRGLSVREAARLQSFPDSFKFKGFLTNQQQQVGNAVPPILAKTVFQSLLKAVK